MDYVVNEFLRRLGGLKKGIKRMYLFGSRARGDEKPSSDYDILVVAPKPDREFREKIYDVVVDVLLETGRGISLKIFKEKEFKRLCKMETPFTQNVLREGIRIG